jgi:glutaredoxin
MLPRPRLSLYPLLALALWALAAGCDRPSDGTQPASAESLPELTFGEDTPSLMLTWFDEKGDAHVEVRASDVPIKGRNLVRVVVADSEHGHDDPIYVADLSTASADGKWAARAMPRAAWEAAIAKRREAYLASVRPPPVAPPEPGEPGKDPPTGAKLTVIIYGADWCRPCHEAADYLKTQGVPVVVKDIEKNPSAQSEMRKKLARVGRAGSSIPIIDVGGEILIGFDRGSLDRALRRMRSGTVL